MTATTQKTVVRVAAEAIAEYEGDPPVMADLYEGGIAEYVVEVIECRLRERIANDIRSLAPHKYSLWHDAYWHAAEVASGDHDE